jgi:hypothetical protein
MTDSTDSRGVHGFHGFFCGIKPFSGVLALFLPRRGIMDSLGHGFHGITDSTGSRIPRDGIPAAKPLCPRLPHLRQLELLVFGPHPAARVGEVGCFQCVLTVDSLEVGNKKLLLDTRGCHVPLRREVRSECGIVVMCALTIDTAS